MAGGAFLLGHPVQYAPHALFFAGRESQRSFYDPGKMYYTSLQLRKKEGGPFWLLLQLKTPFFTFSDALFVKRLCGFRRSVRWFQVEN